MPITLNCPKCHKPFRVRDESIGGRVRCPSCGSELQVPSALSPASNFGDEAAGESTSTPKPVAEEVRRSVPEIRLGDAGRRDDVVSLDPPPGAASAGPPSIKARFPVAPSQPSSHRTDAPMSTSKPLAKAPVDPKRPPFQPAKPTTGDERAWSSVAGGLRMIRWGLFFLALILLAFFGHGVWIMFDFDRAMSDKPGLMKKEDWPLWKEVLVAYTVGPLVPAVLLLLFGRMKCCRVPSESYARSLALGSLFFKILAIVGIAGYVGITYFNLNEKMKLPDELLRQVQLTCIIAAIPSFVLAEILTLLFIGQLGWPIGRPSLQRSVAGFFVYVGLLPMAVLIGMVFFPVFPDLFETWRITGIPLGEPGTKTGERVLIWAVLLLTGAVMLLLRYAGVAGAARRGIRKMIAA